jgi:16S rRNA (cytidine1402-2'-O)-methyltransferase
VRECVKQGIQVECLPGATAFVPALMDSGFPSDRFCFEGFLPLKKGRQSRLEELANETRTIVIYESPYRVVRTLSQLSEYLGNDRSASVSREISKIYEETVRGPLQELTIHFIAHEPRGEFVLVIMGKEQKTKKGITKKNL